MAFRNPSPKPTTMEELADAVFTLMIMGDDRAIYATYIMGQLAHEKTYP
jgi:guanine deaminase